ncbi:MAG: DUF3604 domain-containing protein [Pseudomonadales bacterium]|nr:DUF3604 domain-containing protein [Pseudomonadales bacterium]
MQPSLLFLVLLWVFLLAGCTQEEPTPPALDVVPDASVGQIAARKFLENAFADNPELFTADEANNASRQAYFGDLHVHTAYSFDAFAFGTIATPDDGYRYAKGEAIRHPSGYDVKLKDPLDFYAITDHAGFLGALKEGADPSSALGQLELNKPLHNLNAQDNLSDDSIRIRGQTFASYLRAAIGELMLGDLDTELLLEASRDAWKDIVAAAERHNMPHEFTTFVAYEYTTTSNDQGNLHRNVVFRGADRLPAVPFSRFHSQDPEGLWNWMDKLRAEGVEALAIPHNSNGSNGQMFKLVDWVGDPMDEAYIAQRIRNEPLVEITQVKGTSETHPALSTTDEWADFEIMPFRVATQLQSEPSGSYVREALLNGLALAEENTINPYKFGFIGASDTHNAASAVEEDNYFSKVALIDGRPGYRGSVPLNAEQERIVAEAGRLNIVPTEQGMYTQGAFETWGASGLTGVWAESNTRDSIYDAFRRKETFATSGPRIRLRFFAGFELQSDSLANAYSSGVSMGSELFAESEPGQKPSFLVWATQDARSAPLQRLQIIKGWRENGEPREQVFDVACSDGAIVDPTTHRCPDNGATVNLDDCSFSANVGTPEIKTVWTDPNYVAEYAAFYYARVLENPTCRWSTWDAIRAGVPPREGLKLTIQERAWSSPIWINPE